MTDEPPPRFRLIPSDVYSAKKAKLTGDPLRRVEEVEKGIARNPDHMDDRWPDYSGDGRIDFSASDVGWHIKYRRDDRHTHRNEVALLDLVDLRGPGPRRWPEDED
jgi:hypothetical protein